MWRDGDGSVIDAVLMALAFGLVLTVTILGARLIDRKLEKLDRSTRYDESIHDHDRSGDA